jgi:hypothetical protein
MQSLRAAEHGPAPPLPAAATPRAHAHVHPRLHDEPQPAATQQNQSLAPGRRAGPALPHKSERSAQQSTLRAADSCPPKFQSLHLARRPVSPIAPQHLHDEAPPDQCRGLDPDLLPLAAAPTDTPAAEAEIEAAASPRHDDARHLRRAIEDVIQAVSAVDLRAAREVQDRRNRGDRTAVRTRGRERGDGSRVVRLDAVVVVGPERAPRTLIELCRYEA